MAKSKEQPKEQQQQEAKQQQQQQQQQPKQQPKQQQPKEQPKQQQPKEQPKHSSPVVKRITYEYFARFNSDKPKRKSWVKETIEAAKKEPIMVKNLRRGQIMALINQIDRHNMGSDNKIVYKYDIKRGIVLLAPKQALITGLNQQKEGAQK